jgi:hypothetical protein
MSEVASRPPAATWREVGALILLPFGGLVVPVVGWFAGVVLLWVSDAWTTRDKWIGTVLLPGGLLFAFWLFFVDVEGVACVSTNGGPQVCTGGGVDPLLLLVGVAAIVAPLGTAIYLLWRLRHPAP